MKEHEICHWHPVMTPDCPRWHLYFHLVVFQSTPDDDPEVLRRVAAIRCPQSEDFKATVHTDRI